MAQRQVQRHHGVAAVGRREDLIVVAGFRVSLAVPCVAVAGGGFDKRTRRGIDGQVHRHHGIAARRVGECPRVVAGGGVGHPTPLVLPTGRGREGGRHGGVDGQVERHHTVAAVDVAEHTHKGVVLVEFVAVPFVHIAGIDGLHHGVGRGGAQTEDRRTVTPRGGDGGEGQRVGVFEELSAPQHRQIPDADGGVENRHRRLRHRDAGDDHAVAARRTGELLHIRAALGIYAAGPFELLADGGVEGRETAADHGHGHHHHTVAAVVVRESPRLRARAVEDPSVPDQRQRVLADGAVQGGGVGIVDRQVQAPGVGASVLVHGRPLVDSRCRQNGAVPVVAVAGGDGGDGRGGVRHGQMHGGGAVAAVDVGDGDGLRARSREREPAHGHRQALRADERIELHGHGILDGKVDGHGTVAAVLVGQRLRIVAAFGVVLPVPEERPADGGVETAGLRGVHGERHRHDGVAARAVGERLRIDPGLRDGLAAPEVGIAHRLGRLGMVGGIHDEMDDHDAVAALLVGERFGVIP